MTSIEKREEKPLSRWLGEDLVEIITQETPKDWIENRKIRGGGSANYVPGYKFTEKLNEVFGFLWSTKVLEWRQEGDHLVVLGQLSVRIPGRKITREYIDGTKEVVEIEGISITKEQFGGSDIKRYAQDVRDRKTGEVTAHKGDIIDLADDFKSAATDSRKKCSLDLGMFGDIYSKRGGEGGPTDSQLEALYFRGEKAGFESKEKVDEWVTSETSKKVKDLEQLEIMGLISQLVDMAKK